jgi:hypothetical protein
VFFDEWVRSDIYAADTLVSGQTIHGPGLVEATGTTVLVHPSQQLVVDDLGDLRLSIQ